MLTAFIKAMPIAVGILLASLPLVSVSLLLSRRPEQKAYTAFLCGWIVGALTIGVAAIAVSDLSTPGQQAPSVWVVWLRLFLGLGLVALALRKLSLKYNLDEDAPPKWMHVLERMQPSRTFGLGAALAALNPKNAALFISGALTIAAATYAPVEQIGAVLGFVVVASMGLASPWILSLFLGARAEPALIRLNDAMAKYSGWIVIAVLVVLGVVVFANAIADLQAEY